MSMGHNEYEKLERLDAQSAVGVDLNLPNTDLNVRRITGGGGAGAALTAQKTTITIADAEGTPDTAISAITQTTPFGFAEADEAITFVYAVQNLQVRLAEIEARLEAAGIVTAN
jgi:hypothetical protein